MQRELLLLREMRDAATAIRELVDGRSSEQVGADGIRRSALLWHFTVLGEAASQVPSGTKDANPKIAWRAATRLRNRIVHGYWDIDVETLVATAVDDLPDMITQLESAIASLQEPEGTDPALCDGQRFRLDRATNWCGPRGAVTPRLQFDATGRNTGLISLAPSQSN